MSDGIIPIKGLDHIVLRVRDIDTMLHFYGEVLGCKVEKIQEDLGLWQLRAGDALIDFATVDGPIGEQKGPAPGRDGHNQDHFCLLVDPWDETAIRSELEAHGLVCRRIGNPLRRYRLRPVDLPDRSRGQHGRTERPFDLKTCRRG